MKISDIVLNESSGNDFDEILSQPFFRHNPVREDNLLVHHTHNGVPYGKLYELRKMKARNKPRDTPPIIHNYLNELSTQKFGIALRSETLFTYALSNHNEELIEYADYGDRYVVVPKGDYTLYYHAGVHDFTDKFDQTGSTKMDFVKNMMRKNRQSLTKVVGLISDILHDEIDMSAPYADRTVMTFIGDVTHMVSVDFSHRFTSDSLGTLIDELESIIEFIVNEAVKGYDLNISEEAHKKIIAIVYQMTLAEVENSLNALKSYVDGISVTKKVEVHTNEEYMVDCKEFFIISLKDFVKYIDK